MANKSPTLRRLLRSYLRRRRPLIRQLAFNIHGVDLEVTTDREETAQAISMMLKHARRRTKSVAEDPLQCYVYSESIDRPPILDQFSDAELLMEWETTGYFGWQDLCLIDFYPWGTALIDPGHSVAVLILNSLEIPPPLIFSNQVFFQTLEILLHTRGLYPMHASVVARGGRAVLFPAESGAGKTTLALTLVQAGFRYLGDDKPLVAQRNGRPRVLAFPEPVNTYVDELRQFDQLPKRIHPEIPADIPLKQSFYIEDYWPGSVLNSAFPSALVFPESRREDPGASTLITPISQTEGLRRLVELNWPGHLPWGLDGFLDMMRDLAACTPCYTIRCGTSLDDVPEKIGELMDGWKGRRVV
jgi:hypothetical protein